MKMAQFSCFGVRIAKVGLACAIPFNCIDPTGIAGVTEWTPIDTNESRAHQEKWNHGWTRMDTDGHGWTRMINLKSSLAAP
jgi:hypothetical protein